VLWVILDAVKRMGVWNRLTECCVYVSKTWKGQDREAFICDLLWTQSLDGAVADRQLDERY